LAVSDIVRGENVRHPGASRRCDGRLALSEQDLNLLRVLHHAFAGGERAQRAVHNQGTRQQQADSDYEGNTGFQKV